MFLDPKYETITKEGREALQKVDVSDRVRDLLLDLTIYGLTSHEAELYLIQEVTLAASEHRLLRNSMYRQSDRAHEALLKAEADRLKTDG